MIEINKGRSYLRLIEFASKLLMEIKKKDRYIIIENLIFHKEKIFIKIFLMKLIS